MVKFCFYVPESHLDSVKQAVFDAGAGKMGDYDHCCWQTQGQGQFRPLPGSKPFLGEQEKIEAVAEIKVEMLCDEALIKPVLKAFFEAHPYEEPAYDVIKVEQIDI